jgi:hypothetical protein
VKKKLFVLNGLKQTKGKRRFDLPCGTRGPESGQSVSEIKFRVSPRARGCVLCSGRRQKVKMDQKHRMWLVLVCGILLGALLLPMRANAATVSRLATGVTSVRSEGELQLGERNKQVYEALKTAVSKIAALHPDTAVIQAGAGHLDDYSAESGTAR